MNPETPTATTESHSELQQLLGRANVLERRIQDLQETIAAMRDEFDEALSELQVD